MFDSVTLIFHDQFWTGHRETYRQSIHPREFPKVSFINKTYWLPSFKKTSLKNSTSSENFEHLKTSQIRAL